jgi:hypothetical protein
MQASSRPGSGVTGSRPQKILHRDLHELDDALVAHRRADAQREVAQELEQLPAPGGLQRRDCNHHFANAFRMQTLSESSCLRVYDWQPLDRTARESRIIIDEQHRALVDAMAEHRRKLTSRFARAVDCDALSARRGTLEYPARGRAAREQKCKERKRVDESEASRLERTHAAVQCDRREDRSAERADDARVRREIGCVKACD